MKELAIITIWVFDSLKTIIRIQLMYKLPYKVTDKQNNIHLYILTLLYLYLFHIFVEWYFIIF
jgi:hypothetical protein